jgi:hypothetical protein
LDDTDSIDFFWKLADFLLSIFEATLLLDLFVEVLDLLLADVDTFRIEWSVVLRSRAADLSSDIFGRLLGILTLLLILLASVSLCRRILRILSLWLSSKAGGANSVW